MEIQNLKIFCDGGARGNPGPAGIGVVIVEQSGREKRLKKYIGIKTNNQAEYEALLYALKIIESDYKDINQVEIYLDSELVVKQMKGDYKIKNEKLGKLLIRARNLIISLDIEAKFYHIKREKNHRADKLVNYAIDEQFKK